MPLFSANEKTSVTKAPVRILKLSCGAREVTIKDNLGYPVKDANGVALTQIVRDLPRTYVIRFIPFSIDDGSSFNYRATISSHKLANGTTVPCDAHLSCGCEYCKKQIPRYDQHYSLVWLARTDSANSVGIYAIKYNGWLEEAIRNFDIETNRDDGIDITSLLDDGCYVNLTVSMSDSGYQRYSLSVTQDGACPFRNDIRNAADVLKFCNSPEVPDLEGYVNKIIDRKIKKAYNFEDITKRYERREKEYVKIIRDFNEDEEISDMFSISVEGEDISDQTKPAEVKIGELSDIEQKEEELKKAIADIFDELL